MKQTAIISILSLSILSACNKDPSDEPFVPAAQPAPAPTSSAASLPPGHPMVGAGGLMMAQPQTSVTGQTEQATVVSTIDIEGFTYIEVKQGDQTRWLAANTTQAKKGALIKFDRGSTIENFTSKTLRRTFPSMTFVNTVTVVNSK